MSKCEACVFSRPIISENGFHAVCTLPDKENVECVCNRLNHYKPEIINIKTNKQEVN